MSNRYTRVLVAGGAVVLVAGLGGPAAVATATAGTWTVRPGGAITATAGATVLTDPTTDVVWNSPSSGMSGTLTAGSGLRGATIGSITAAAYTFGSPTGLSKVRPRGLPWQLNLTSYNPATGAARGTIRGFKITLIAYPDSSCRPVINGTSSNTPDGVLAFTYSDQTGKLTIRPSGSNLHWYHDTGCAGLFNNGDPATLGATYTVRPKQDITSP
jgi:hypothetical protein